MMLFATKSSIDLNLVRFKANSLYASTRAVVLLRGRRFLDRDMTLGNLGIVPYVCVLGFAHTLLGVYQESDCMSF